MLRKDFVVFSKSQNHLGLLLIILLLAIFKKMSSVNFLLGWTPFSCRPISIALHTPSLRPCNPGLRHWRPAQRKLATLKKSLAFWAIFHKIVRKLDAPESEIFQYFGQNLTPLQSIFSRQIFLLYFVKGKFGGKKFTLQKSESTLQKSYWLLDKFLTWQNWLQKGKFYNFGGKVRTVAQRSTWAERPWYFK